MKRKLLVIVLIGVVCLAVAGCKKKEDKIVGGWQIDLEAQSLTLPDEALNAFNEAMKNQTEWQLEPVALLGTQVVAGTNYMFFCSSTPTNSTEDTSYKIVTIYKDLNNVSILTNAKDFEIEKYAGKDIEGTQETLMGGWTINQDTTDARIREEVMEAFKKATKESEAQYTPIVVLAKQVVAGTNYAILTLKEENEKASFQVLTIYQDLQKNAKITHSAYVNLADYNG